MRATLFILIALVAPLRFGCTAEDVRQPRRAAVEESAPHLPNPDIDVQSYDVDLTFAEFAHGEVPARATVRIKLLRKASELKLNIDTTTIDVHDVKVDGAEAAHEMVRGLAGKHGLRGDLLRVELGGERAARSIVEVTIDYSIRTQSHSDRGLLFRKKYQSRPIFVTRSWPYYARFWLPSNDHPADPATFTFTLRVPEDAVAAANGKLIDGDPKEGEGLDEDGLRLFRWEQTTAIPVYGAVVAVGPLEVVTRDVCFKTKEINADLVDCGKATHRVPMSFYIQEQNKEREDFLEAAEAGARSLALFSSMLEPYAYDKLGFVTAPHPFNMESVSMIVMVSAEATVHEVAHHWWGNTVYIGHWGDLWISEGFTTYFTGLFDEFVDGNNTACKQTEGRLSSPQSTDPLAIFDDTPYCKGSSAVADLRARVTRLAGFEAKSTEGRDLFFALARDLFREHRFERLTTEDLISWLRQNIGSVCARRGRKVAPAEVDAMVAAWEAQWFSP